jgi:hypothetical protein
VYGCALRECKAKKERWRESRDGWCRNRGKQKRRVKERKDVVAVVIGTV